MLIIINPMANLSINPIKKAEQPKNSALLCFFICCFAALLIAAAAALFYQSIPL